MKSLILAGSMDQTIDVFIQDSSSTTGAGLAGLVYNTIGLKCYYRKGATGTSTALTLATQTVAGVHFDGGFVEIDATNMKGVYRLDLSDVMVDTAGTVKIYLYGATNMAPCVAEVQVYTTLAADAIKVGGTTQTAGDILGVWTPTKAGYLTGDAYIRLGAPAGVSVSADVAAVKAKTDNLPAAPAAVSNIPTANENADALLARDLGSGTGAGTLNERTVRSALRWLRNKWTNSGGTLTIYKENDTDTAWTSATIGDAAANPIVSSDPT